jgi:tetratricopeptide (TPR) repeat protein
MTNSAFGDSRDIVPHRAQAYRYSNGSLSVSPDTRLEHAFDEFTPFIRTAGGLNSTAEEVARWIISLQKGILLKESSLKTLWTNGAFNDGSPTPWALGWSTNNRLENPVAAGIGGRRSAFFVYSDDDLAIVILTNLAGANPEEFIDDVAGYYIPNLRASNGGGLPAAIKLLRLELLKRGFENAPGMVIELKKKDAKFQLTEDDLNNWGGKLMEQEQNKQAIEIFKLNVSLYPQSANTYDSLAEAYERGGNRELAVKNYWRSLELDSRNTNAIEHLKKLDPDYK